MIETDASLAHEHYYEESPDRFSEEANLRSVLISFLKLNIELFSTSANAGISVAISIWNLRRS
jgi:hypothetical protein